MYPINQTNLIRSTQIQQTVWKIPNIQKIWGQLLWLEMGPVGNLVNMVCGLALGLGCQQLGLEKWY